MSWNDAGVPGFTHGVAAIKYKQSFPPFTLTLNKYKKEIPFVIGKTAKRGVLCPEDFSVWKA